MKEDTQLLIEKFKYGISEIKIQYQLTHEELDQCHQQLDQIKEQAKQQRCSQFIEEKSLLKESERNATLDSTSKDGFEIQTIGKIEDLRLLASQKDELSIKSGLHQNQILDLQMKIDH
ncbi:hypothetical protein ACTA71_008188 [Dictyostelium dimigraforme]